MHFLDPSNSVIIGAFGMYSVPAVVLILTYRTIFAHQKSSVKLPPFLISWTLMFIVNGELVSFFGVWLLEFGSVDGRLPGT